MTDPVARRLLTELLASQGWPVEGDQLLHQSLGPRPPELLLEAPGWLGLDAGQLVLEAGCRDATHAIALARRYRCRVLGVDLVPAWLPKGRAEAAAAGLATQIALVQGDLEALPVADGACDLVWCRDVLSRVGDCGRMLAECARVLRPGGGMVLYAVFATDQLAPGDRALLVDGLHNSPSSMHQPTVEAAIAEAGFEVVQREQIASEWSEYSWNTIPVTSPRTCWRSPGSPATATRPKPPLGRSGTGALWRSPPGSCRSCWADSCQCSMPWADPRPRHLRRSALMRTRQWLERPKRSIGGRSHSDASVGSMVRWTRPLVLAVATRRTIARGTPGLKS
jgi:ubiquinone/menaquinone biosynthesis C-methylase UbiE